MVVDTTEGLGVGVLGRVLVPERRLGMVCDRFTHVSGEEEEGKRGEGGELGFEEGFDGLSDFEACPGRGRGVVQKATYEVSGPCECPGKGR